jgi:hypothetical protein
MSALQDKAQQEAAALAAGIANTGPAAPHAPGAQPAPALDPNLIRTRGTGARPKVISTKKRKAKKPRRNDTETWAENGHSFDETFQNPIPCRIPQCKETFASVAEADHHVQQVHGRTARDLMAALLAQSSPKLKPGGAAATPQSVPDSPPPVTPFPCPACNKLCGSEADRTKHFAKHHKPAQCYACPLPACAFPCQSKEELVEHCITTHAFSGSAGETVSHTNHHPTAPAATHFAPGQPSTGGLSATMAGLSMNGMPAQGLAATGHSMYGSPATNLQQPHDTQLHRLLHPAPGHLAAPNPYIESTASSPWRRDLKSGSERSSIPRPRVVVKWPHEAFDSVLGQQSFAYSDLTAPALAAGAIAMLFPTSEFQSQTCEPVQVYLEHLSILFHSLSLSNNLPAVLEYHRSVLQLIESGCLTWSRAYTSTFQGLRMNFLATLRNVAPAGGAGGHSNAAKASKAPKETEETKKRKEEALKIVCQEFSYGRCTKSGPHDGLKHVCLDCVWRRQKEEPHKKGDCPYKGGAKP